MIMLLQIVDLLLSVIMWIIVVQAILSWLVAFNVVNTHNDFVRQLLDGLSRVTEPLYRPIRRIMPDFGALDFSPMVVLLIIYILRNIVLPRVALAAMGG
ncbi:YggT family protein [Sphingomonas bacterium]|uniref:YggT family protein n=1 Tax=Sphingomonas bacterium TaxID=1895847 RepID=UPI001574FF7A|nr:YggT family protein [Sphingomonas bacterium]